MKEWIKNRGHSWLEIGVLVIICTVLFVIATGCTEDRTGHADLPEEDQMVNMSDAVIVANPDGYPNIAHKCMDGIGFWTTTDRTVIIIYNDWSCPGSTQEKEMTVINAVPRSIVNTGQ